MEEVLIDLRHCDLADRLKLDMISIDALLNRFEDALDIIDRLQEEIDELNETEHEKRERGVWEMFDLQYKEKRMREMEGLE